MSTCKYRSIWLVARFLHAGNHFQEIWRCTPSTLTHEALLCNIYSKRLQLGTCSIHALSITINNSSVDKVKPMFVFNLVTLKLKVAKTVRAHQTPLNTQSMGMCNWNFEFVAIRFLQRFHLSALTSESYSTWHRRQVSFFRVCDSGLI